MVFTLLSIVQRSLTDQLVANIAKSNSPAIESAHIIEPTNSQYQCEFFSTDLGCRIIISKGSVSTPDNTVFAFVHLNFLSPDCENVRASSFLGKGRHMSAWWMIGQFHSDNPEKTDAIEESHFVVSLYSNRTLSAFLMSPLINSDS